MPLRSPQMRLWDENTLPHYPMDRAWDTLRFRFHYGVTTILARALAEKHMTILRARRFLLFIFSKFTSLHRG